MATITLSLGELLVIAFCGVVVGMLMFLLSLLCACLFEETSEGTKHKSKLKKPAAPAEEAEKNNHSGCDDFPAKG